MDDGIEKSESENESKYENESDNESEGELKDKSDAESEGKSEVKPVSKPKSFFVCPHCNQKLASTSKSKHIRLHCPVLYPKIKRPLSIEERINNSVIIAMKRTAKKNEAILKAKQMLNECYPSREVQKATGLNRSTVYRISINHLYWVDLNDIEKTTEIVAYHMAKYPKNKATKKPINLSGCKYDAKIIKLLDPNVKQRKRSYSLDTMIQILKNKSLGTRKLGYKYRKTNGKAIGSDIAYKICSGKTPIYANEFEGRDDMTFEEYIDIIKGDVAK